METFGFDNILGSIMRCIACITFLYGARSVMQITWLTLLGGWTETGRLFPPHCSICTPVGILYYFLSLVLPSYNWKTHSLYWQCGTLKKKTSLPDPTKLSVNYYETHVGKAGNSCYYNITNTTWRVLLFPDCAEPVSFAHSQNMFLNLT